MKLSNSSEPSFPKAISFDNGLKNLSALQLWHLLKQNIRDAYCITDEEGIVVEVNDHFCHTLEYQEKELLERNVTDLLPAEIRPYALMLHHECIWEQSEENDAEWVYLTKSGNKVVFHCHSTRLLVPDGKRYKLDTLTLSQPTKKPTDYDEDLVKKMQHQFKNTLHEINGLLHLQAVQTQGEVREAIMLSQMRVTAIAVAYELLYRSAQPGQIELSAYLAKLAEKYRKDYEIQNEHPTLYWPVDKAYALGIMLTEFLNSGRGNTPVGSKLTIEGKQVGQQYHLRVLSENFTVTLPGFSRQLINALANQLRAKIDFQHAEQEVFSITCSL